MICTNSGLKIGVDVWALRSELFELTKLARSFEIQGYEDQKGTLEDHKKEDVVRPDLDF